MEKYSLTGIIQGYNKEGIFEVLDIESVEIKTNELNDEIIAKSINFDEVNETMEVFSLSVSVFKVNEFKEKVHSFDRDYTDIELLELRKD